MGKHLVPFQMLHVHSAQLLVLILSTVTYPSIQNSFPSLVRKPGPIKQYHICTSTFFPHFNIQFRLVAVRDDGPLVLSQPSDPLLI